MASIHGVRLPDLVTLKKADFEKRLKQLSKYAGKVCRKTPKGLPEDEALEFLDFFKPAFGDLVMRDDGTNGGWSLVVGWFKCPACKLEFDEKDSKAIFTDGYVHCPRCSEKVCEEETSEEEAEAEASVVQDVQAPQDGVGEPLEAEGGAIPSGVREVT